MYIVYMFLQKPVIKSKLLTNSMPRHKFMLRVQYDLDLGNMILSQGHETPLGHGQKLH